MRVSIIFLIGVVSLYANFNRTSGVIDVPTGSVLGMGQIRFGGVGALALSPSEDRHDWDTDLSVDFGLPSEIEASLTVYSARNIVALGIVRQLYSSKQYQVAFGAHDLSYTKDVSSVGGGADTTGWDDDVEYNTTYTKPNENMSFFIVGTKDLGRAGELTLGLGRGRYVGYGPNSRYFNTDIFSGDATQYAFGLFLGYTFAFTKSLDLLFDLDGRDANLGLRFHARQFEADIAAIKLEQLGSDHLSSWLTAAVYYKLDLL